MGAFRDLTGIKFNRLTAIKPSGRDSRGRALWACLCDCGASVEAQSWKLVSGKTKSCGCLHKEQSARNGKATSTHGLHMSPEYRAWHNLKSRCLSPSDRNYQNYGGRGIQVCERWLRFENFYADMGPRPSPKHSLDRRENDGHYEPGNCRWVTSEVQSNNRRTNVLLSVGGVTRSKTEWARHIGISFESLTKRISKWGVIRALTTPAPSKGD